MSKGDLYTHWRDSARTPKFFIVDARAAFAVILVFFHPHWGTVAFAVVVLLALGILNHFNIPLVVAMRLLRGLVAGKKKFVKY